MFGPCHECTALWQQAQRSPSIIGFNVSGDLAETVTIALDGDSLQAVDVRLWEGIPGVGQCEVVFLELLFLDVPPSVEDSRVGEACLEAITAHLRERRVKEFRERLAERKKATAEGLRRRGAQSEAVEGGDEQQEAWREYLGKREDSDPQVRLHAVVNIGGKGRRVLAVRTSMAPGAAHALGQLAYPRLFLQQTEEEMQAVDRAFNRCYYGCLISLLVLFLIWAAAFASGMTPGGTGHTAARRNIDSGA